ncbi:hypothetical protein ACFVHQ_20545 [Actinomycetes bacterium NPDC127524]
MSKYLSGVTIILTFLFLSSPVLARENPIGTNKIEFPSVAPSNYVFNTPDAKAKASSGCFFYEVSWKMQDIFRRFDVGEIDEDEVAKLIQSKISTLLPDNEYKIALQLSERKAKAGK